jgi:hypothetical protein
VERETQVQKPEDIAGMLNNMLNRQLGVISNRVYTQVERRLNLERARRGK